MNYRYFLASFLFVFLSFNAVKAQAVISEKQAERALKKEQRQLKRIDRQYSDSIAYKAEYYQYMLLEDLDTRNFENLGWWQYQYNYYNSIIESAPENLTGKALIVDRFAKNVMVLMVSMLRRVYDIEANRPAAIRDIPAVVFLLMLRTIVHPKDYVAYLAVISYSSKMEDYGTALFYVEALLENGYTDLDTLGALPETGLLRIMPEYQALLEVYLNKGLYGIREEDS
ncbi:MAG: hypothetical protein MUQ45_02490 [Flavobacteriaceae bacterium]|nr:hypothetical protein [Flavobacteriaceae bacterium]MDO7715116.1 hypothetical protein [Flavobacteriaceae bacterium]